MKGNIKGSLMLLTTAFIWGTAFVAQSSGMDYIGPLTFNTIRNYIASLSLIPVMLLFSSKDKTENSFKKTDLIKGGIICGVLLCLASSLQQVGIKYTSVGKAGFITTLYVVIIPLIGLFSGKKIQPKIWL